MKFKLIIFPVLCLGFILVLLLSNKIEIVPEVFADVVGTYYIDAINGNDANDGSSISASWKYFPTDTRATAKSASHTIVAGDTFVFKRGVVYDAGAGLLLHNKVGTPGKPITITSISSWGTGERAILDGGMRTMPYLLKVSGLNTSNIIISNLEARNVEGICFDVDGGSSITLSNLIAHSEAVNTFAAYGIYMHGTLGGVNYINDCEVYNSRICGIVTGNTNSTIEINRCIAHDIKGVDDSSHSGDGFRDGFTNGLVIYNNCVSYNNQQDGWDLFGSNNKIVNRCKAYNNTASGFKLGAEQTTYGIKSFYSTAYGNGIGFRSNTGGGFEISNNVAYQNEVGFEFHYTSDSILKNNIGYNNTAANLQQFTAPNIDENNIWYQDSPTACNVNIRDVACYATSQLELYKTMSGTGNNTKFTDPKFVSALAYNFSLQPNSPAINAGTNVGLTADFAGNPIVGLPDIGAFEYQASGADTTAPAAPSGVRILSLKESPFQFVFRQIDQYLKNNSLMSSVLSFVSRLKDYLNF